MSVRLLNAREFSFSILEARAIGLPVRGGRMASMSMKVVYSWDKLFTEVIARKGNIGFTYRSYISSQRANCSLALHKN
jgi:hypothetical protein